MSVRVTRTAQASWQGDLVEGGGRIGVAHAGCVTMSLANLLAGTEITLEARLGGN